MINNFFFYIIEGVNPERKITLELTEELLYPKHQLTTPSDIPKDKTHTLLENMRLATDLATDFHQNRLLMI
jgi:hypothetical protein